MKTDQFISAATVLADQRKLAHLLSIL